METRTTNDVGNSERGASRFAALLAAGIAFAVHLFVTIVIVAFLGEVVPRYEQFFAVHDTPLPAVTRQLIILSHLVMSYWYLLALAIIAIDGPIALGVQFLPRRLRWLKVCWLDSYLLAAIFLLFLGSIALCVPIEGMLGSVAVP